MRGKVISINDIMLERAYLKIYEVRGETVESLICKQNIKRPPTLIQNGDMRRFEQYRRRRRSY